MLQSFPVEIIEQIMLYLNSNEIEAVFVALDKQYHIVSDHFWKTLCLKEDFIQMYPNQEWYECFHIGMDKRLGRFTQLKLNGELLNHIFSKSVIISRTYSNSYKVYILDSENKLKYTQEIEGKDVQFRDEFITAKINNTVMIYAYTYDTNLYEHIRSIPEIDLTIFGINKQYLVSYNEYRRYFSLFSFDDSDSCQYIILPNDVKFVLPFQNILESDRIIIPVLTVEEGYKIKIYDIKSSLWTLDLSCYGSTGVANIPNIWISSNFFGCCDVSYRSHRIYFGLFKVWDKDGMLLLQQSIEPSNKYYLHCFFKDNFILLTTSDNEITVFNSCGQNMYRLKTSTKFVDIKISSGHLLFVLLQEVATVAVYDWVLCMPLYSIQLDSCFNRSKCNEWFYCPYGSYDKTLQVFTFSHCKSK